MCICMHVCVLNKQISDCSVVYDTEREINKGEKKHLKREGSHLIGKVCWHLGVRSRLGE